LKILFRSEKEEEALPRTRMRSAKRQIFHGCSEKRELDVEAASGMGCKIKGTGGGETNGNRLTVPGREKLERLRELKGSADSLKTREAGEAPVNWGVDESPKRPQRERTSLISKKKLWGGMSRKKITLREKMSKWRVYRRYSREFSSVSGCLIRSGVEVWGGTPRGQDDRVGAKRDKP